MKTKQVIHLVLAVLLSSASLTNLPTQVSAAESSSSSSVSSSEVSQSSTSKESTTSTSESSKSESSQSVLSIGSQGSESSATISESKATVQSSVAGSSRAVATGTPSDAKKPSKNGWWFILTLRQGFTSQPVSNQYVVGGDVTNPTKFEGMQLAKDGLTSVKKVSIDRWHWDATGNTWVNDKLTDTIGTSGILGLQGIDTYAPTGLTQGSYYYQFRFTNFFSTFYSNLARVEVLDKPVQATSVKSDLPDVLYTGIRYATDAVVEPSNATDIVQWAPNEAAKDKLTFVPNYGRSSKALAGNGTDLMGSDEVKEDTYYNTQVNKDPKAFGIPTKMRISAGISAKNTQQLYIGGLAAMNVAKDAGGTWALGGLQKLSDSVGSESEWQFEWHFTDASGNVITTPTANQGVTNTAGSISNLPDLNTNKGLTFAKDSSFMQDAAAATASGNSYRAQAYLTTKIGSNTLTIKSNLAELQVVSATGKLTLDAVPDFNFGTITASKLYDGTLDPNTAPNAGAGGTLTITDTRVPATGVTNDWTLKATASKFTSGTGSAVKTLNSVTMKLTNILGIPGSRDLTETENTIATKDGSSVSGGTNPSSLVKASLLMTPNPEIQLTDGDAFSSQITWNLTTTQPTALAAK